MCSTTCFLPSEGPSSESTDSASTTNCLDATRTTPFSQDACRDAFDCAYISHRAAPGGHRRTGAGDIGWRSPGDAQVVLRGGSGAGRGRRSPRCSCLQPGVVGAVSMSDDIHRARWPHLARLLEMRAPGGALVTGNHNRNRPPGVGGVRRPSQTGGRAEPLRHTNLARFARARRSPPRTRVICQRR
jgi:hypothetical protein